MMNEELESLSHGKLTSTQRNDILFPVSLKYFSFIIFFKELWLIYLEIKTNTRKHTFEICIQVVEGI